jgi:hypothetical protein
VPLFHPLPLAACRLLDQAGMDDQPPSPGPPLAYAAPSPRSDPAGNGKGPLHRPPTPPVGRTPSTSAHALPRLPTPPSAALTTTRTPAPPAPAPAPAATTPAPQQGAPGTVDERE